MQTVYIDIYFLVNFSMDFLCLYLTAKLLSERMPVLRFILAAALGGVYANVSLLIPFGRGVSLLFDVLACAVICAVAFFRPRSWQRLFLYILVYTAVSAALGGSMTALYYLFNRSGIFDFIKSSDGDGISVWLFAILALISAVITLVGGGGFKRKMSAREASVEITYKENSVILHGMTDSGNLLCEPVSGRPCIVVRRDKMKALLPPSLAELSEKGGFSKLDGLDDEIKKRVVLIPSRTVSGNSLLIGIRVDGIRIGAEGRMRDADAIVVLSELSDADALIPSGLMI